MQKNYGQHAALLCAFNYSKGAFVITIDDDLQYDPSDIIHLINKQKETAADVAYASAALSGAAPENAIRVIATDLKRRHPQADKGEVINYLLTAYCPFVKQASGLTEREKRERMDRFSSQVYAIVQ